MAKNPGFGDGSAPVVGDLVSESGGSRPRVPRRGDQVAGLATSGDRDGNARSGLDMHQDAVRRAVADYNSGAADMGGGQVGEPITTSSGTGGTWADPSSQG